MDTTLGKIVRIIVGENKGKIGQIIRVRNGNVGLNLMDSNGNFPPMHEKYAGYFYFNYEIENY